MALVMVQGHVADSLLSAAARADPWYLLQTVVHGSTAPGFLFASGFVAGLPRAPLSWRASLRRARRLLFVLGVGYALHLPYFSFWKTVQAGPVEKAAFYACDALQVIALSQIVVLGLQWLTGRRWIAAAATLTVAVLAVGPWVWSSGLSRRVHPALGAYLDVTTGSHFPVFPFAAFVLAGTVAGALVGRQEPATRRRRALVWGTALLAAGLALAVPLDGRVYFWGVSPAYVFVRLGGLLLLLQLMEHLSNRAVPGLRRVALLGHETLLVYVLHLQLLFGGVLGLAPLAAWSARLGFVEAALVLAGLLPVLLAAAWLWHRAKTRCPHESHLLLVGLSVAFLFEMFTRPW
jgi:hypothetical protein